MKNGKECIGMPRNIKECDGMTRKTENVKKFEAADWPIQVDKPSKLLESITGKPVEYFAYPFGLWNPEAIPFLKERGFKAAFQLSAKRDEKDPLHTIRRIIVPGEWSAETMMKVMRRSFP